MFKRTPKTQYSHGRRTDSTGTIVLVYSVQRIRCLPGAAAKATRE